MPGHLNRTLRLRRHEDKEWMELRMGSVFSVFLVMALTVLWLGLSLAMCRLYEKCLKPCNENKSRGSIFGKIVKKRQVNPTKHKQYETPTHFRGEIVEE